ncbi:GIY-YIG nuclease family protein [Rhodovastum atsumiense]|uniref:GIY-YIG domain-containing protein n=1 Tax=Rhodovastum atsumiense TaxID=504468 RepID=A0A5M6ING8_9PROT|nr:hypothetical protein [Rhodovastum atsumiense]KAA5609806.1 hypothetical protein F1189_22200 [Rhodovastum atsumiense]
MPELILNSPDPKTLNHLIASGFCHTGTWRRSDQGHPVCDGAFPDAPGIYLFVEDERILYVGSAEQSLCKRLREYMRNQRNLAPNKRPVHHALANSINNLGNVKVYTRIISTKEEHSYCKLPVDLLLGVESGLIKSLNPPWNRRGSKAAPKDTAYDG